MEEVDAPELLAITRSRMAARRLAALELSAASPRLAFLATRSAWSASDLAIEECEAASRSSSRLRALSSVPTGPGTPRGCPRIRSASAAARFRHHPPSQAAARHNQPALELRRADRRAEHPGLDVGWQRCCSLALASPGSVLPHQLAHLASRRRRRRSCVSWARARCPGLRRAPNAAGTTRTAGIATGNAAPLAASRADCGFPHHVDPRAAQEVQGEDGRGAVPIVHLDHAQRVAAAHSDQGEEVCGRRTRRRPPGCIDRHAHLVPRPAAVGRVAAVRWSVGPPAHPRRSHPAGYLYSTQESWGQLRGEGG